MASRPHTQPTRLSATIHATLPWVAADSNAPAARPKPAPLRAPSSTPTATAVTGMSTGTAPRGSRLSTQ